MRRTWLTDSQAALLELGLRVRDQAVAQADAELAAIHRLIIGEMDVPENVTGDFKREGGRVVFVEATPDEDDGA